MIRGIVLAGGSGKRMWPLSRERKPKQLLKLFLHKTFLEETITRLTPVVDTVAISTGKILEKEIKKTYPKLKLIVEPERRDTAAAIGLCAIQYDDDDVLVFVPSDAYIDSANEFGKVITKAVAVAEREEGIVTIGIKPRGPSTTYGYLEVGRNERVTRFCEKPTKELAQNYIKQGYLWNAGMFVVRAGVLLDLFKAHEPILYNELMKIQNGGKLEEIYPSLKKISFDYAIMEKAKDVFFVVATFYWNDVGGFPAICDVVKDINVVLDGELAELNSAGNIVSSKKLVALVDCKDLIVIDTLDALLVCPKSSADKIKTLVESRVPQELH